jgi:hypothetical protein
MLSPTSKLIAFSGSTLIASGSYPQAIVQIGAYLAANPQAQPLIFDAATGHQVDLDLRQLQGKPRLRVVAEAAEIPLRGGGKGRPRLGVVAREVTLLPRHWDWLAQQPGGSSVTLRKLVERAIRDPSPLEQQNARGG